MNLSRDGALIYITTQHASPGEYEDTSFIIGYMKGERRSGVSGIRGAARSSCRSWVVLCISGVDDHDDLGIGQ